MPPQQPQRSTSAIHVATSPPYVEERLNAMAGWLRVIGGSGVAWAGSLTRSEYWRRRGTRVRLVGDVQRQLCARAAAIERTIAGIGVPFVHEDRATGEEHKHDRAADLAIAHRRKDEFLATLAHELRNPLAPMLHSVELMRRLQPDAPVAIVKAREILERQLAQLVRLVDDLLDVSRIASGKLELRRERASIHVILQQAIETSRPLLDGGAHTLTMSLPDTPVVVDGDVTRLSQVFTNLLNNAAKYSERARTIHVSAQQEGATVVVRVRDEGIGIAPDEIPHVFDLFMQADRTLERSQGGLGVGLSLVKRLVEQHGGTVNASSEGIGNGSAFTVRLPLAVNPNTSGGAVPGPPIGR